MQICNATVRIRGELTHTVKKTGVTPAEITVLRYIHGADAVVDIIPDAVETRTDAEERERLSNIYERANPVQSDEQPLLERIFGVSGPLPQRLRDIGVDPKADAAKRLAEAQALTVKLAGMSEDEPELDEDDEEFLETAEQFRQVSKPAPIVKASKGKQTAESLLK